MKRVLRRIIAIGNGLFVRRAQDVDVIKLTKANAYDVKLFLEKNNAHFVADVEKPFFIITQPSGGMFAIRAGDWLTKHSFLE